MAMTRIFFAVIISVMLISCAGKKKGEDVILPAEQIYNNSMKLMTEKKYKKAIEGFEELERTYPYSKWATKAEIMAAYTNYKNEDYTSAIIVLDKFIGLHPGNKDIQYAYYLKSICYYDQISDVTRDQSFTVLALSTLREVVARFPDSDYARDAQGKVALVLDHLAGKELTVGRFYLKQRKYIAAINRFQEVINNYQTTSHVPEALHRLVEANVALGLQDEARKYASVLGYNYPGSDWYAYSYELIEGKKPETMPEDYKYKVKLWIDKGIGIAKNPLKYMKGQPNLVDDYAPVKVQPKANDRSVKIEKIGDGVSEAPVVESGMMGKIGSWFKSMNIPFMEKK